MTFSFARAARTVLALLALSTPVTAQDTTSALWSRETIKSARLHEDRTLLVATPANYRTSNDSFPVLVLLDAEDRPQFTAAVANIGFLASRSEIPGLIVVGVTNGKDRTHDLTPPASGNAAKQFPSAGGADAFEDFIVDEVLPYVRGRYRTRPSTLLAGHSFGGLFAVRVAASRPSPFAGIIAMSPSLWWNDSTVVATYADGLAKAGRAERLFATSGGLEPDIDRTTRRFVARLDSLKPASVAYSYLGLPDDTHGLTPAPSLVAGLRFVFEPVSFNRLPIAKLNIGSDSTSVIKAVIESEAQYARGARSLALPEKLPEPVLNSLGYNVLQGLKLPAVAVWVFGQNAANYPASANVHDSWGDGLLAMGDTAGAIAQFKLAVNLAARTHDRTVTAASGEKLQRLGATTKTSARRSK